MKIPPAERLRDLVLILAEEYRRSLPRPESLSISVDECLRVRSILGTIDAYEREAEKILDEALSYRLDAPTPEESALWKSGNRDRAILEYRIRTGWDVECAYAALKGMTMNDFRKGLVEGSI